MPGIRVGIVHPGAVRTPIYTMAANYVGRVGRPPPPVYTPEAIAEAILAVAGGGRRSRSVGMLNPVIAFGFTTLPRLYDTLVTPIMNAVGLSRRPVAPHPGNVFTPSEDVEALRIS
jgi:short-subunit dehydrogenase